MRFDENGQTCPSTLGEYRDVCEVFGIPNNKAVAFLDKKIAESPHGRDEKVLAPDSQMTAVLMPMMVSTVPLGEHLSQLGDDLALALHTAERLAIETKDHLYTKQDIGRTRELAIELLQIIEKVKKGMSNGNQ